MMHTAIFPSWRCQLSCSYCSVGNSQIDRKVAPVPWERWATALPKALSRGSIVDVSGGEPLLYPGIHELLHAVGRAGLRWALGTNGKDRPAIHRLCRDKPPGCVCINVSDHKGNPEAAGSIALLREAGYLVVTHRVDHPDAGRRIPDAKTVTYQDWKGGRAVDGKRRRCNAGVNHWVAGANGDLWRCVVAMETGQPSNGNLFTRELRPIPAVCDFGCSTCYTEDPASWCVEMEAAQWATT